jgi:hypothetical protein
MAMPTWRVTFTVMPGSVPVPGAKIHVDVTAPNMDQAIFQATIEMIAALEAASQAGLETVFNRMCEAVVGHEIDVDVERRH